ncbi:ATP-binding cassette subfamily G member 4 isoform X1 [Drosophila albomicans]|uniref:ATP-binding cassette subfamily G member 4 isoform X1 n=1 Tax=Drosophila albomicans TaxID=7291 RepID=A0A9C6STT6_DROAB|nr:ATP-binding cassette subfamily G member 4 isoform X1 [Drosophila albomicans]XP_051859321.1 ATP-binding cassette subfamily G member 4 isoform X1 [Drosophila albomicans]XP_051859322.1 ATP-binding cassette subfamily G member 4 isoform X1 [Drosophila albomicans]XP_051859323.1 ATP-binding cassette subfamily G member 4 isoform X1 [Drosophila albomicans]XP_051859324.1 ATP-binding cassette subfamily G member 4 isoform X1 [Drosophila albomicans]XP_051859325.1 ATP-binding cassette subfamily G member 
MEMDASVKTTTYSQSGSSIDYSSDINAISVELPEPDDYQSLNGFKYLPAWPAVNLEFSGLTFEVPDENNAPKTKKILRDIHGEFRSHELSAIMGPSGAGKTTLLNLLAGFGSFSSSGEILVNNNPRDMRIFRKMSRYIMQTDILDLQFTVSELMLLAANLKLGNELKLEQKIEVIDEILGMLRLKGAQHTKTDKISGGERKRLSIALELVNNPPILFLDEPTTGLDDLSSSQCITLLKMLASGGRTVICSIHTPSAKIFEMIDKVYVLAEGQCIYQGSGVNIVRYMNHIGLSCPLTYNPADFIIEVACHEYGNGYHNQMVEAVRNGRVFRWSPSTEDGKKTPTKSDTTSGASTFYEIDQFEEEMNPELLISKSSWWMQYKLLLVRMMIQMWRDKSHIKLKFYMNIILALIVGGLYQGVGRQASKALFNFGFMFTIVIAYLYLPMMPVLLQFPTEIKLLKREYFNQWYRLSSYYAAMLSAKLPSMFILAVIYLSIVYLMSSQPLEWFRFIMLFIIAFLTALTSDSFGLLISSRLSLVNGMFMGPVLAVPLILLSIYGIGYGKDAYISPIMRFLMSLSFLRHGMEGLVAALYDYGRGDTICEDSEMFCMFKKSQFLLMFLGFENMHYLWSVCCLIAFYLFFTVAAYILIRKRLKRTETNHIGAYVLQLLTKYFNFTSYNY